MEDGTAVDDGFDERGLEVWRAFVHAYAGVVRRLESQLRSDAGLTISQYLVLRLLHSAPEQHLRMAQIAQEMRYSSGAATRLIDPLVKSGYLQREASSEDRRSISIVLTDAGNALYLSARPRHVEAIQREFLARLQPDEKAAVGAFLRRLASLEER